MRSTLLLLLAACADPRGPSDPQPPPSAPPPLRRLQTVEEPGRVTWAMTALPVSPPRALLQNHDPLAGSGLTLVERVGDALVTHPAPLPAEGRASARVADATGDGVADLIVRTERTLRVWDPATWTVLAELPVPSAPADVDSGFWPVAADADPEPELVISWDWGTAIYDLSGGPPLLLRPTEGTATAAQLDADPTLEVVLDQARQIIDGATLSDEGLGLATLGYTEGALDLDGDGLDELVLRAGRDVALWDPRQQRVKRLIRMGDAGTHGPLFMADAHGDGDLDLWVPTAYGPNRFWIVDPHTGATLDVVARPDPTLYYARTALWDSDGDGDDEVLYAGNGWLGLVDTASLAWVGLAPVNSPGQVHLFDADGDGQEDLVACNPTTLELRDPATTAVRRSLLLPAGVTRTGHCDPGDLDGDGDLELAVGGYPTITIYDLRGGALTPLLTRPGGDRPVRLDDLDGDHAAELLWVDDTGAQCAASATITWCAALADLSAGLVTADLDGDGVSEVVVQRRPESAVVLSGATGQPIQAVPGAVEALAVTQVGGRSWLLSSDRVGGGVEIRAWGMARGQLRRERTYTIPALSGISLQADGADLWASGFDGIALLNLHTGAIQQEHTSSIQVDRQGVVVPAGILVRVSDGWIRWGR
jgi:hypothetical protein